MGAGQIGDEQYLEQLIGALRQLHDRMTQVGAGPPDVAGPTDVTHELNLRLGDALAIASNLNITRMAAVSDIPDFRARLRKTTEVAKLDEALKTAVLAIRPDYSVDAIDNAIRVAESQRDFSTDP